MDKPALERLLVQQACQDTVIATARAVDAQPHAALAQLFTPDGVLARPDGQEAQGRAAIEAAYAARDPDRMTQHLLTNFRVEPLGPDAARASCAVLLWTSRHSAEGGPRGRPADATQLLGEFQDELVLTPEGWRIRRREARFLMHR